MSIESSLKKDGIEVISKLDTLKINTIARNVSQKICGTFPEFHIDQNELFIKLSRLDMYIADMPEGMAEANYFYKNSSIYFNSKVDEKYFEDFAIHECIHYIQERKDKKNYLLKMGLCNYSEFKVYGLALNEAAVQLMVSKILATPKEDVKYFNISFETTSPNFYPIQCALVNQLAYITGEDILFESTINSNDDFKEELANKIGYKNFIKIQNLIDDTLALEEEIQRISNKLLEADSKNRRIDHFISKIDSLKKEIANTFVKTQNLIIHSYFDKKFEKVTNVVNADEYRKELYSFKDYIGYVEGYKDFNTYYVNKMEELEYKMNMLEHTGSVYLIERTPSKLQLFFRSIKRLLSIGSYEIEQQKEHQ